MSNAQAIAARPSLVTRFMGAVSRLREALDLAIELKRCDPETARRILEERGLIEGPHWQVPAHARVAVRMLYRLMGVLGIDPQHVNATEPQMMRKMQRVCISCPMRSRCEQAFERCESRSTYQDFCPNAAPLDALRLKGLAA
jgi:hypothetical protein